MSTTEIRERRPLGPLVRRRLTVTGSALAVAVLPLAVAVLCARAAGADPTAPINALIAGGAKRPGIPVVEWRRRAHTARVTLRRVRAGGRGALSGGPGRPRATRRGPGADRSGRGPTGIG
ncbi:hypothetical protein ACN20G_25900 [Streptomyces sp. BI20]|uniref:hypothetical protein n=1 Tax=Streptomyces sp. BI20 TaxID=3403460 RepID=UPI003C74820A